MPSLHEKIQTCKEVRTKAANMIVRAFQETINPSELALKEHVAMQFEMDGIFTHFDMDTCIKSDL